VGRVEAGHWDGVIHYDALLGADGIVARRAEASVDLRHEVLPVRSIAFPDADLPLYALLSTRLGCDTKPGKLDLAALCFADD
jgi:hypothetical protein